MSYAPCSMGRCMYCHSFASRMIIRIVGLCLRKRARAEVRLAMQPIESPKRPPPPFALQCIANRIPKALAPPPPPSTPTTPAWVLRLGLHNVSNSYPCPKSVVLERQATTKHARRIGWVDMSARAVDLCVKLELAGVSQRKGIHWRIFSFFVCYRISFIQRVFIVFNQLQQYTGVN